MHLDLRNSWASMIFIAVCGTLFIALLAVLSATDGVLAYRARTFVPTPALVTSFKLREVHAKHGTRYMPEITYTYTFAGQSFTGNRFAVDTNSVDEDRFQTLQAKYAKGMTPNVYVDPANPAIALVDISPPPFFALFPPFLAFAAAMFIVGWIDLGDAILWRARRAPAGGVFLRRIGRTLRVTMPPAPPLVMAAGATLICGVLSLIAALIWAIATNAAGPTAFDRIILVTAATTCAPALPVYIWARWMRHSGKWDLVLDELRHTIQLPPTFGRTHPRTLPLARIVNIWDDVDVQTIHTKDGSTTIAIHQPTIEWHSDVGRIHKEKVAEWQDGGKAKAFTRWLQALLIETDRHKLEATAPPGRQSILEGLYTSRARER